MILTYSDADWDLAEGWAERLLGRRSASFVEFRADQRSSTVKGLVAEICLCRLFEVDWTPPMGADSGVDMALGSHSVQVKFNHYPFGDFYCRPDQPLRSELGILVVPADGALRVAGWLDAERFDECAVEKSYGHNVVRAVGQSDLWPIIELLELYAPLRSS